MKAFNLLLACSSFIAMASCSSSEPVLQTFSCPEENVLELVRISGKSDVHVVAHNLAYATHGTDYENIVCGYSAGSNVCWGCAKSLAISPDGKRLAYLAADESQRSLLVCESHVKNSPMKRINRNMADGIFWGKDNQIYFSDNNDPYAHVSSVDAERGTIVKQVSKGDVTDYDPVITDDDKYVFFSRWMPEEGPVVFRQCLEDGSTVECGKGFGVVPDRGRNDAYFFIRNTANGRSELCHADMKSNEESIILSDAKRSYTHPALSPDGKWLLVVGNTVSIINKADNLDIFAVRTDGSNMTQLTYHPGNDLSPVWARDVRSIFFLSNRNAAATDFSIWRMNFRFQEDI